MKVVVVVVEACLAFRVSRCIRAPDRLSMKHPASGLNPTHRLRSSSFLGLPCRTLNMNHKKGLRWSLGVHPKPYKVCRLERQVVSVDPTASVENGSCRGDEVQNPALYHEQ